MQRDGRTATIPSWAQATFIVLLAGGAGLIGWSFAGPEPSGRRAGWPQEQALKYQAASARLHQLSLEAASEPGPDPRPSLARELDQARAEYETLLGELEAAIARPLFFTWLMRIAGVVLVASGTIGLLFGLTGNSRSGSA